MSFDAKVYRVMIASPSDTGEERQTLSSTIHQWNVEHAGHLQAVLIPAMWETDTTPEMGERPQGIINRQVLEKSDILIGVFWSKLGTPTGVAASGTVEEIQEFLKQGKRVMLYFSKAALPNEVNVEQLGKVREFRAACMSEGLFAEYSSISGLRDMVYRQLTSVVREIKEQSQKADDQMRSGPALQSANPVANTKTYVSGAKELSPLLLKRLNNIYRLTQLEPQHHLVEFQWVWGNTADGEDIVNSVCGFSDYFGLFVPAWDPEEGPYPLELFYITVSEDEEPAWDDMITDARMIIHDCRGTMLPVRFIILTPGRYQDSDYQLDRFKDMLSRVAPKEATRFSCERWGEYELRERERELGLRVD